MLILAATPIGQVADASGRLADALVSADVVAAEDTRRLKRLASDLGRRDRRPGRVVLRGQRGAAHARARRDARRRPDDRAGDGRRDAQRVRSRLPARGRGDRGRRRRDRDPRPVRGAHGARGVGPAGRPVLLRGLPAPQGRRAHPRPHRAGDRASHDGVLRVAAPHRDVAAGDGRGVRRRPCRRGVPRADQDVRGGGPRRARRAGRVGCRPGAGRARRGHDRRRRSRRRGRALRARGPARRSSRRGRPTG